MSRVFYGFYWRTTSLRKADCISSNSTAYLPGNTDYIRKVIVLGCALTLFISAGCVQTASTITQARQRGNGSRTSATNTKATPIAQSAAYRAATVSFAHHDIAAALKTIDSLLGKSDLSDTDRTFLLHQQTICRATLTGKAPSAVANVLPSRRQSRTAAQADCGPRALLLACQRMHVPASLDGLRKAAGTTGGGTNLAGLIHAAQTVGIKAEGVQMDGAALANLNIDDAPALAWVDGNHYVAVLAVHGDSATIHDPNKNGDEDISLASGPTGLLARSGGILLLLSRSYAHKLAANIVSRT